MVSPDYIFLLWSFDTWIALIFFHCTHEMSLRVLQVEQAMVEALHDVISQGVESFPASHRAEWVLQWPGQVRGGAGVESFQPATEVLQWQG